MKLDQISDEKTEQAAILAVTASSLLLGYMAGHKIQDVAEWWAERETILQKILSVMKVV